MNRRLWSVWNRLRTLLLLGLAACTVQPEGSGSTSSLQPVEAGAPAQVDTLIRQALLHAEAAPETGFQEATQALNGATKSDYLRGMAHARAAIAYCYDQAADYETSLLHNRLAYGMALTQHDTDLQIWCLTQICFDLHVLRSKDVQIDSNLYYLKKLDEVLPKLQRTFLPDQSALDFKIEWGINTAGNYYDLHRYREAANRWLGMLKIYPCPLSSARAIWGNAAWAYDEMNEPDSVLYCTQQIYALDTAQNTRTRADYLVVFGAYKNMIGQANQGIPLQKEGYALLAPNATAIRANYSAEIVRAYEESKQYDSAFAWMQIKKHYTDALALEEQRTKAARVISRAAIQDTEAKLASADRQHIRTRRWLVVSGAGLLLLAVIAFFAVRSSRRQRSQNLLIRAQAALLEKQKQSMADNQAVITQNLEQKETLLREIHHRVKNNLQVVNGLLRLQLASMNDVDMQAVLRDSQMRIEAMALIHQQLYQGDDLAGIDLYRFGAQLYEQIARLHPQSRPLLENRLPALSLNIDTATPLSLILNELITNSFKHAFPHTPEPRITLWLAPDEAGRQVLSYKDYGPGLPPETLEKKPKSLGLTLLKALSKQLGGTFEYDGVAGVFRISFFAHVSSS